MPKKTEAVDPDLAVAAEVSAKSFADAPSPFDHPEVKRLRDDTRKIGKRRLAKLYSLVVSSDFLALLRQEGGALSPENARIFGVPFEVDGNADGVSWKLVKGKAKDS